jgi:hypothetical protein
MDPVPAILLVVFLLITLVLVFQYKKNQLNESFANELIAKPSLWWIVDTDINSRHWWDFGARNSIHPNKGYLKIALECAEKTQGMDFFVQVLLGRKAVSDVLERSGVIIPSHIETAPVHIWQNWAMANLLATKGGLAMIGDSTLCVGPSFGKLVFSVPAATFGISSNETSALPGSQHVAPSPWVGWSHQPLHPGWKMAAETWNAILHAGPTAWSAAESRRESVRIWNEQKNLGVKCLQTLEGGRNPDGSERTMEDLFARVSEPQDPKTIVPANTVYIPYDGDALARMHRYSWFVRMSKDQILESDFIWAVLAKQVLSR